MNRVVCVFLLACAALVAGAHAQEAEAAAPPPSSSSPSLAGVPVDVSVNGTGAGNATLPLLPLVDDGPAEAANDTSPLPPTPPAPVTQCGKHEDCVTCVSDVACGWCGAADGSEGCFHGNYFKPTNATGCTIWEYGFCAGEPCSAYANCDACIHDPYCGWCAGLQLCTEGDEEGPIRRACPEWSHRHGSVCPSTEV